MVVIGRLGSPYGVRGWIKLFSFTEPVDNILRYPHWFIEDKAAGWLPIQPAETQVSSNHIRVKFAGCDSPEQARLYTQLQIAVTRDQLPALESGEYYWSDLEGLKVINQQGVELGYVQHLFSTGANDVMVVKGERERLLPYIKDVVLKVDLVQKQVLVDWDADF